MLCMLGIVVCMFKGCHKAEAANICGIRFLNSLSKNINYQKVTDHCHYTGKYRGAVHNICNLKFIMPNKTSVVFYRGPIYNYHFVIKELANEFEG